MSELKPLPYAAFVYFDGGMYEWCSGNCTNGMNRNKTEST
jgi:hypothetical protein